MMKNKMILLSAMTFALFLVLATTMGTTTAQNVTENQSMSAGNWTNQTGNMTGSNLTAGNVTTGSPASDNTTTPS
jgi:hypothetical protein